MSRSASSFDPRAADVRPLLDALADAVIAADASNTIAFINAAGERLFGWTGSELHGRPLTVLMPERLRASHQAGFERYRSTGRGNILGRPVRVPALHRDGTEIDIELTLSELRTGPRETLVLATIRDLRERVELERKLVRQRKVLAQHDAVGVLLSARSLDDAIPRLLEATGRALGWDVAGYWHCDRGHERLTLHSAWACSEPLRASFAAGCRGLSFGAGEGLPGRVLASGEPVWSGDARIDPRYVRARLAAEHGLRSALLFPVYGPRRIFGVLEYLSTESAELDEELRQVMGALGFQVGQFVERLEAERELERARAEAEAERDNLQALFTQAPAAVSILRGPELRYALSNPKNQELAGGRALLGRPAREALPELDAAGVITLCEQVYRSGEPQIVSTMRVMLPATGERPEQRAYLSGVLQPLRGPDGAVEGVMSFSYDVTELMLGRARVEEAEEQLRVALGAADLGTWDYQPATRQLRCDARYKQLFGAPADFDLTFDELVAAIHPDDRARVLAASEIALDPRSGGEFNVDYRTVGIGDGRERWVAMRGRALFDERALPVRFVGIGRDITRERAAHERLAVFGEVSALLAASLDYPRTLAAVARALVPRLGDHVSIELLDGDSELKPVADVATEAAHRALARGVREHAGAELAEDPHDRWLIHAADAELAPEQERLRRELGITSMLIAPLAIARRVTGYLTLFASSSKRLYSRDDLALAHELGRRIALAVENARLFSASRVAIQRRDEFLSIASHELKTPVTSLSLYLDAFVRDAERGELAALPPERLLTRVLKGRKQLTRLTRLIDELLDVSRIASAKLVLDRSPTDLSTLANEVVARFAEQARAQATPIAVHAPRPVVGSWDRERLAQVVSNLVANALKYAPGQPIEVRVEARAESALLSVQDRGPGIERSDQARIFDRFERTRIAKDIGGFGLGLWIVKEVVAAHGGTTRVESEPGRGARFTVELPYREHEHGHGSADRR